MPTKKVLRIAFFVDGFTLKKVNEYYRQFHPYHTRLNFRGLKSWTRREAVKLFAQERSGVVMECHYYHPYRKSKYRRGNGIVGFERELRHVGFNIHYAETATLGRHTPNIGLMDDAMMFASYGHFDVAVLLSTQAQYSPFPEMLRCCGVRTLVLGWNFAYPKDDRWICWKTDEGLREKCDYYVAMEQVANAHPPVDPGEVGLFEKAPTGFRQTA